MNSMPRILCIGGHDPSGGAGVQADIETVAALGGQALTLLTALTEQDTHDIRAVLPTPAEFFRAQATTLLDDIRPDAVKVGLIGAEALFPVLRGLLERFDGPVVLDPVLAAGGGHELDSGGLARLIREQLLPLCTLVTPNRAEARRLAGLDDPERAALELLRAGARAVLLTGADEARGDTVENRLLSARDAARSFSWPRLPGRYHGSGCTLASACATRLALGDSLADAAERAQAFTWRALERATRPGGGQWLPRRIG
jgi:hydroxymethylpyrimidine/phosphomethylpyrimidine kinase